MDIFNIICTVKEDIKQAGYEVEVTTYEDNDLDFTKNMYIKVSHKELNKYYTFNCEMEPASILNTWEQVYEFAFGQSVYDYLDQAF